jgi:hypothetical protein
MPAELFQQPQEFPALLGGQDRYNLFKIAGMFLKCHFDRSATGFGQMQVEAPAVGRVLNALD